MKTATCFAPLLCALLLLAGCGETKQPLTRTELVEWPVLVYVELPPALTDPLQAPAPPPPLCHLHDGTLTPCAIDAIVREAAWQQLLQRVNDDRATSERLSGARKMSQPNLSGGDATK